MIIQQTVPFAVSLKMNNRHDHNLFLESGRSATMITDNLIFKASGQYDKEIIQHLHITCVGVTTISNIDRCVSLTDLNLSSNNISAISGLDNLVSLQRLDLSFNRIARVENLSTLGCLEYLDLRGNNIADASDLHSLSQIPQLRTLFLRSVDGEDGNPICNRPDYPSCVLSLLPDLEMLDGGHALILSAFTAMNQQMDEAKDSAAEADAASSYIAPEAWFQNKELQAVFDPISLADIDRYEKSQPSLQLATQLYAELQSMLSQDGGALIRKATLAMSAASK